MGERKIVPDQNLLEEMDPISNKLFSDESFEYDATIDVWPRITKSQFISWNTAGVFQAVPEKIFENTFTTNNDSSTQVELLHTEYNKVQQLIFIIRKSLFIRGNILLANRILTLYNDALKEDSMSLGISVESLHNFYDFLRLNPKINLPNISLTPDNTIYASWKNKQDQLFSAHFLPNEDVRFVVFIGNKRHPGKKIRFSGFVTCDILLDTVKPFGITEWIFE